MRSAPRLALLVSLAFSFSCSEEPVGLTVDVLTDWAPSVDFVSVQTELSRSPFEDTGFSDGAEVRQESFAVTGLEPWLDGVRVAELADVGKGPTYLRVSLRSSSGRAIARRVLELDLTASFSATILLTKSCQAVVCPAAGGAPELSECQGGTCVDPRCSPSTPEHCPPPMCDATSDCGSVPGCDMPGTCIRGYCLCAEPRTDAGPVCLPSETSCADGMDDDCDGFVDCEDPDCASSAVCGDCTVDADCGGVTTGSWGMCGDFSGMCGESGTRSREVRTPRCDAGACVVDTTMESEACMRDTDGTSCGSTTTGSWGACGGFSGTCDETGTQSRTITDRVCTGGTCQDVTRMESQGCMRSRSGVSCGSTTYSGWSACGGFSGGCDTTGSQSRTRTDRVCNGGSCTSRNTTENRGCSRTVMNGTSCGGPWQVCCGGSCVNTAGDGNHCGACGVSCNAIGLTCVSTGTGGYACRGCVANSTCQAEYGGTATCWDVAAPPAFCQCQCPSNVVCSGGGCGAGMYCHDCPGHNFCAPFGGSC